MSYRGYKERMPRTAFTISDNFRGTLPPVEQLALDIYGKIDDPGPEMPLGARVRQAIELSKEWSRKAGIEEDLNLASPERDTISVLYLDAIRLLGESFFSDRRLLYADAKKRPRNFENIENTLRERKTLQAHLSRYDKLFGSADHETLYGGLEAIMYDAACLIFNKGDLSGYSTMRLRTEITGALSEYKVLKAVRNSGLALARYSSPEEDFSSAVDIVVPIGEWQKLQSVGIQVKAKSNANDHLTAINEIGIIEVGVPMHRRHHPFNLPIIHTKILLEAIRDAAVRTFKVSSIYN